MTREEAIRHIRDVIAENNSIKPNIVTFEQEKEALYMAIEALSEPRGDLISRTKLFNKLATVQAPPEANEYKAEVYKIIQSMGTEENDEK